MSLLLTSLPLGPSSVWLWSGCPLNQQMTVWRSGVWCEVGCVLSYRFEIEVKPSPQWGCGGQALRFPLRYGKMFLP